MQFGDVIPETLHFLSSYSAVEDSVFKVLSGAVMSTSCTWPSSAMDLPQRNMDHCFSVHFLRPAE